MGCPLCERAFVEPHSLRHLNSVGCAEGFLSGQPGRYGEFVGVEGELLAATAGTTQEFDPSQGQVEFIGQPAAKRIVGGAIDRRGGQSHAQGTVVPADEFRAFGVG